MGFLLLHSLSFCELMGFLGFLGFFAASYFVVQRVDGFFAASYFIILRIGGFLGFLLLHTLSF